MQRQGPGCRNPVSFRDAGRFSRLRSTWESRLKETTFQTVRPERNRRGGGAASAVCPFHLIKVGTLIPVRPVVSGVFGPRNLYSLGMGWPALLAIMGVGGKDRKKEKKREESQPTLHYEGEDKALDLLLRVPVVQGLTISARGVHGALARQELT